VLRRKLKVNVRIQAKSTFVAAAVDSIPGRSQDDIKEHEKWYQKYLELQAAKKRAIVEWKLKKVVCTRWLFFLMCCVFDKLFQR